MTGSLVARVVAVCLGAAQPTPSATGPAPAEGGTDPDSNTAKWESVERISTPPPVPPQQAPAPVQADTPPQSPAPPSPARRIGNGALGGGIALLSVGFASLVFVGGVAGLVKLTAVNNAKNPNTVISSREDRYNRARRADNAMQAGFWIGLTGIGLGIALIAVGATMKSRARREEMARRVSSGAGGVAIRF